MYTDGRLVSMPMENAITGCICHPRNWIHNALLLSASEEMWHPKIKTGFYNYSDYSLGKLHPPLVQTLCFYHDSLSKIDLTYFASMSLC